MKTITFLVLSCLLVSARDDEVKKFIEQLGSSRLKDRDQATEELIRRGKPVLEAVRKAAESNDPEVRTRAKEIVVRIELRERLPASLFRKVDWLEFYLKTGHPALALNRLYVNEKNKGRAYGITSDEWEALVKEVLRRGGELPPMVITVIAEERLQGLAKDLFPFLKDNDMQVRMMAADALDVLVQEVMDEQKVKTLVPTYAGLLKDKDAWLRRRAIWFFSWLRAREYAPEVAKLMRDESVDVRANAVRFLGRVESKEYIPQIGELLRDDSAEVRGEAIWAMGELGARENVKQLVPLLLDPERYTLAPGPGRTFDSNINSIQKIVLKVLVRLKAREAVSDIKKLLDDTDDDVRAAAREALQKLEK